MYNPFSKGRWYRFRIESNGTNLTIRYSDIKDVVIKSLGEPAEVNQNTIILPVGYRALSAVSDINFNSSPISATTFGVLGADSEGKQNCVIPPAAMFSYMELYIFAKRD